MYFYDIKEQKRTDRPDIKGNHLTIPFDVVLAKTLPKVFAHKHAESNSKNVMA